MSGNALSAAVAADSEHVVSFRSDGSEQSWPELIVAASRVSAALAAAGGARIGEARFYSTVSHRHVYGMLFRLLWPLLHRRPFATFDLEYPEQLLGLERSTHVLVSSPALLKRIGHLSDLSAAWRAIFSSGGLLPAPA